jgi:hypothetical protein
MARCRHFCTFPPHLDVYRFSGSRHHVGMVLSIAHASRGPELFVAEERLVVSKPPRPTVYLDTTIPSYLTTSMSANISKARMQRITRVWWSRFRPNCDIFVSDRVFVEARGGREDEARKRLAALESIEAILLGDRSDALVDSLLADGLFPERARVDAEHLAYAATNAVRFLLTWNCKHLANRMIFRRVIQRCESHGVRCPQVCTPETLMRIYAYERHTY